MTPSDLLTDAIGRVLGDLEAVLDGLTEEQLTARPTPDANSIAWLVWHLTRVQDDHVAGVAGIEQVWTAQGYADRFGLPFPVEAHGYGHSSDDVAKVRGIPADLLLDYYRATHRQTLSYVAGVTGDDLDRIVDTRWDPPVTLGVRLVSVINDCTQHAGQAAYLRGLLDA
ncbi:mycothiol transferase [Nocardioides montaniterrae]